MFKINVWVFHYAKLAQFPYGFQQQQKSNIVSYGDEMAFLTTASRHEQRTDIQLRL